MSRVEVTKISFQNIDIMKEKIVEGINDFAEIILEDSIISEYVSEFNIWGSDSLLNISLVYEKDKYDYEVATQVSSRNLN